MTFTKEQINTLLDNLDEDTLKLFQMEIESRLSEDNKEDQFIELYEATRAKLDALIADQYNCPYDIWEFFWNKLFGTNGTIHRAYKLVPFNTDIIDSSYEDEVFWIMSNWKDTVEAIKENRNKDKYYNEL